MTIEKKDPVRFHYSDTNHFNITTGVLQDDTLAHFLFIICLDYILRKSLDIHNDLGFTLKERRSSQQKALEITAIDYADDLAVTVDNLKNVNPILQKLEEVSKEIGVMINIEKRNNI